MPDRQDRLTYRQERIAMAGGGTFIRLVVDPPPRTRAEMQAMLLESQRITRETGLIVVADVREPEPPPH